MTLSMILLGLVVLSVRPHEVVSLAIIITILLRDGDEFTFGGVDRHIILILIVGLLLYHMIKLSCSLYTA